MITEFTNIANVNLKGKTIRKVRYMTDDERKDFNWSKSALVIVFTDGTLLISSCDDEMNDAGTMHLFTKDSQIVLPSL